MPSQPTPAAGLSPGQWDRVLDAASRGRKYLSPEAARQLAGLFDPATLMTLAVVIGVWAGAQLFVAGWVADAGLLLYGGYGLLQDFSRASSDIQAWITGASDATSEADLEEAGKHFAQALTLIGIDVILSLIGAKVFKKLRGKVGAAERVAEAPKGEPPAPRPEPKERPPRTAPPSAPEPPATPAEQAAPPMAEEPAKAAPEAPAEKPAELPAEPAVAPPEPPARRAGPPRPYRPGVRIPDLAGGALATGALSTSGQLAPLLPTTDSLWKWAAVVGGVVVVVGGIVVVVSVSGRRR